MSMLSSSTAAPASRRGTELMRSSSRFLEKKLDGFGEVFRYLSYLDIGSAAIMSRAAAGQRARQNPHLAARIEGRGHPGDGEIDPARNPPHGLAAPGAMKVRIKFFAILRERAGTAEVAKEIAEGSTVADLWRALQREYPKLDVPGHSPSLRGQPELCQPRSRAQRQRRSGVCTAGKRRLRDRVSGNQRSHRFG